MSFDISTINSTLGNIVDQQNDRLGQLDVYKRQQLKHCLQIYCICHDSYANRHKKFFD